MNNTKKHITLELLLQSLENDFDKQERKLILNELKNSTPTDDALLGAKLILEQNNWDYTEFKKAFSKAEARIDRLANKKPSTNYLKYAAVLIPIALITAYFIYQTGNLSIDKYYTKEAGLPGLMGGKETNWEELMQLYKSNQFEKAYSLTEKIKVQKPENDTINYFQAVIAYDLKKYDIAKEDFEKVTKNKQSTFYNEAEFRLGFALKQLNQNHEAKNQFVAVKANINNPYNDEAKKVLKIMDSSK
jgi:hypothetical protein